MTATTATAQATTTLIHFASVTAKFLVDGNIIERAQGHLFRIVEGGRALPEMTRPGYVTVVAIDLDDESERLVPVTIPADAMVRTYDEV